MTMTGAGRTREGGIIVDLRDLETFYWVVQLGGFRRAAERLHTTQPAVSGRIARMEAFCGHRLLERDRRRVAPTPKGLDLHAHAARLLRLHGEMLASLADPRVLRGLVRVGVAETVVHTWLAALVRRLHDDYPGIELEISVDVSPTLRAGLLAGELDVALLLGPLTAPGLHNLPLCEYPLAWIASPALDTGPEPLTLAALARWPVLTYTRATAPHRIVAALFAAADQPVRMFGNGSLASIVRLMQDGIGIGAVADVAVAAELRAGTLRVLRTDVPLPALQFTASWLDAPGAALAATVARLAQDVAAAASDKPARSPPIRNDDWQRSAASAIVAP